MRLNPEPFEAIKSGRKLIEVRLNDEKRQRVAIGDTITFRRLPDESETITVRVLGRLHYRSFARLYSDFPGNFFGCPGKPLDEMLAATYRIYTREQEAQYGALGLRIELVGE